MNTKPKKWVAAVLGFVVPPLAFLYVRAPRWAAASLVVSIVVGTAGFMVPGKDASLLFSIISIVIGVAWAVSAYKLAARQSGEGVRPWHARWYGLTGLLIALMTVTALFRAFCYEPFRAPSLSMTPAVPLGSNLIVKKWGYGHYTTFGMRFAGGQISAPIERGDIIAFDYPRDPSQTFIKRLIGLPGDKIVYRDKHLQLNGVDVTGAKSGDYLSPEWMTYLTLVHEKIGNASYDILLNPSAPARANDASYQLPKECAVEQETVRCEVPAGSYFVLGDNRDNSLDSRYWGFVPAALVVGKVVAVISPRG
ncbi:hypothetical protein RugamoR57_42310 [Duganella caerulea]|uniref:signal peptidase I n=1 Tax=Duganella caerulea TaxID=2885762 RepID=UPI0030E99C07